MRVGLIQLQHFRNLTAVELRLHPKINLIHGRNGSGKTSLLEAFYLLGHGRSFRANLRTHLIQDGQSEFILHARTELDDGHALHLGWQQSQHGKELRLQGSPSQAAELAQVFPVQLLDTGVHQLVSEGGEPKRRFLDWGVFHVEQHYVTVWRRYRRLLRQRNAALREGWNDELIRQWDPELSAQGEHIDELRTLQVTQLSPLIANILEQLLGEAPPALQFSYFPGWPRDQSLALALEKGMERDRALASTQYGPHRADLRLRLSGRALKYFASRGQQKLLGLAMKLAQCHLLVHSTQRKPVLLVDDLAAELDLANFQRVLSYLYSLDFQILMTSTEPELASPDGHLQRFHVEQGCITAVV